VHGEVWPTTHITELCLQLTAGSGPWNGDEHRPLRSPICERAKVTMGQTLPLPYSSTIPVNWTHWPWAPSRQWRRPWRRNQRRWGYRCVVNVRGQGLQQRGRYYWHRWRSWWTGRSSADSRQSDKNDAAWQQYNVVKYRIILDDQLSHHVSTITSSNIDRFSFHFNNQQKNYKNYQ